MTKAYSARDILKGKSKAYSAIVTAGGELGVSGTERDSPDRLFVSLNNGLFPTNILFEMGQVHL